MKLQMIARLAGALAVTVSLAGCIDVTMDVKVKDEAHAQATMIQTIGAQFYPMIKSGMTKSTDDAGSGDDFCKKDSGVLVENADGSATCTISKEGAFADLGFDDGKEQITFASAGPGLVRVSFPTNEFQSGLDAATAGSNPTGPALSSGDDASAAGGDAASDGSSAGGDAKGKAEEEQMKQMMAAYFAGHFLTVRIGGGEVTESNMTIADDKQSAEQKVPFVDIINGTAKLPEELYAVVKVN